MKKPPTPAETLAEVERLIQESRKLIWKTELFDRLSRELTSARLGTIEREEQKLSERRKELRKLVSRSIPFKPL